MKKPYRWAGVIGGILIVVFLISGALFFSHPSDLFGVKVAQGVSDLLWVGLGVYLVSLYLQGKQAEDAGNMPMKPEADSAEDKVLLRKKQNWVLGFFLLNEILGSAPTWILNNYLAGPTILNIEVIFDLLINIVFLYLVAALFTGRKNAPTLLFYGILLFTAVEGAMEAYRGEWLYAVSAVLLGFYVVYAIKTPSTRKNFRITNFILLPAVVIISMVLGTLNMTKLNALQKNETLLEQQYASSNTDAGGAYSLFLQREAPTASDIQKVNDAIVARNKVTRDMEASVYALRAEYEKELPSIEQQKTLEKNQDYVAWLDIANEQIQKLQELMDYSQSVDFRNLTEGQIARLTSLEQEIQNFGTRLTAASFKLSND